MNIALKAKEKLQFWQSGNGISSLTRLGAKLTSLALIALIAWFLADTILMFMTPSDLPRSSPSVQRGPELGTGTLADASRLFGEWVEDADTSDELDRAELEETSLPLNLIGVFVSKFPERSGAIIASGNGEEIHYLVGDRIPGNVVLDSVDSRSVMLRRGARLERLSFPQEDPDNTLLIRSLDSGASPTPAVGRNNPAQRASELAATSRSATLNVPNLGEKIAEYRAMVTDNPREALHQLGIKPVSTTEARGYRIGDLPENLWVRQTGLQEGDIVLSVNGRSIGDPDLDRLEIDNVIAEGQVRLEIERGERRFFVNAKLSP